MDTTSILKYILITLPHSVRLPFFSKQYRVTERQGEGVLYCIPQYKIYRKVKMYFILIVHYRRLDIHRLWDIPKRYIRRVGNTKANKTERGPRSNSRCH